MKIHRRFFRILNQNELSFKISWNQFRQSQNSEFIKDFQKKVTRNRYSRKWYKYFAKVLDDMTTYSRASQKHHSKNSTIKLVAAGIMAGILLHFKTNSRNWLKTLRLSKLFVTLK